MSLGAILILLLIAWVLTHTVFSSLFAMIIGIIVWGVTGVIAGNIVGGRFSTPGYIALGLAGGITGTFILRLLGLGFLRGIPFIGALLVGVFGAVVFVALIRFFFDSKFAR